MKQQINYSLPLYLIIFSGTVFLLFFAESNLYATRSWSHLWNLGHIPLFMLISYAVYRIVPSISSSSLILQVLLFAGMALVLGAMIEFVQSFVGRQASMQDVMLDMIGGVIFVLVFSPTLRSICLYKKVMLVLLVTSLLVVASSKLIFS
ncbi:MAG: VanZ family protein, partial [Gammaproteobacteria bacterium]|nr:VanZ family protein [Gammaproteobacteria bacterium]